MAWPWHTTDGRRVSWWAAEKAAVVRAGDSWEVCHDHVDRMLNIGELRLPTIKAVFALAALKVLRSPHDLVFWAFWGLKAAERTAEMVDEVINNHPTLITLPDSVVWTDKASALAAIQEIRRPILPTAVYPTQYISSNLHLFTEDPKPTKRKRTTADVDVAHPAEKKARTRTARCTAPKPQTPLGPQRKLQLPRLPCGHPHRNHLYGTSRRLTSVSAQDTTGSVITQQWPSHYPAHFPHIPTVAASSYASWSWMLDANIYASTDYWGAYLEHRPAFKLTRYAAGV
ncbi:hypothetical protein L226DRAFT_613853 [Lentinus tigrinus ALCF2SS1-7]|uniref:uncharacterized protein n=1 Tax=Lentinus tigrinus ALCF2SS1-7 TaxID=1328758 RepID=UPI001165F16A|nr:hypothetical protein L226DRAFT_613853 [Lentinus tigrinus ALCF2SS1-7]